MTEIKRHLYADYRGPGPLAYNLKTTVGQYDACPTKRMAPAYSLGVKHKADFNDSPGPAYSYDDNMTHHGKHASPRFSLHSRPRAKGPEISPGPGAYNSEAVKQGVISTERNVPSISVGHRTKWPFKNEAPPPNRYSTIGPSAATSTSAPAWGLKGRFSHGSPYYLAMKANNPGPSSYGACNPNTIKRSTGNYSMQGRTKVKDYNSAKVNPGPGSYDPQLPKCGRKGFSLGERHSLYAIPVITDLDII